MAWSIEFERTARQELARLDPQDARRILTFLQNRLAQMEDPRIIGAALQGARLGQFWKYRIGDYRVIASIIDSKLQIIVVRVGNRKNIYRR